MESRLVNGLVIALTMTIVAEPARCAATTTLRLTLVIYDHARVKTETLAAAENRVSEIFGRANVQLIWRDGFVYAAKRHRAPKPPPDDPATLVVNLQPESEAARYGVRTVCGGFALGPNATVFVRRFESTWLGIVIAHELAHAWFGGLIEFQPPENEWLQEAITTYVSRSALEAHHPHINPWSAQASQTLPDHAYAKNAAPLKRLETLIGRQAVMHGIGELLRHHANRAVTKDDLAHSWFLASGQDLREWTTNQLIPAPPDEA